MGEVYQAYDELLRSDVALKTLLPKFGADPAMLERFRREVLLARKASHPNVCRVYHLDSTQTSAGEGLDFLTMEFLEGETLSERLKHQGRMSPAEVMPLLRQVAAGLDAAHAEGVIHRDFKTSNVMLVPRQAGDAHSGELRAVVTDFGIARALQSQGGLEEQVTGTGLLGTPEYMAPEQVSGGEVGPAADIYALGLVLYEMLTGSLPFAGATPLEVAVKRVNERPPPPRSVVPELDLRWNAAVLKCLERVPEARFSTAADVVRFLDRPSPLVSRRKVVTVALVGLAVVVGAFSVPGLRRKLAGLTQATPEFHTRIPVAVAGFTSVGDLGDLKWVPSTLAELLRMELEAGETSLRVSQSRRGEYFPDSSVGMAKASLGISNADLATPEARRRLSELLGTQWLLIGTIRPSAQSPGWIEVEMQFQGGSEPSAAMNPFSESFAPDDLLAASGRLGEQLRTALGVSLSGKEVEQLRAARPRSLTAARHYAEGLERLTRTDYPGAQQAFAASSAADGAFHAAHVAEAGAWLKLGYGRRAREAAQRARETAAALPESERQLTEALVLFASGDEHGARGIDKRRFETWPDDPDLALEFVEDSSEATALERGFAVLARWRKAAGNREPHLFLQMAEAQLKNRAGDREGASVLLDQAEQRARAMGARIELGEVLWWRGEWLAGRSDLPKVLEVLAAAEALFRAVPEPAAAARVKMDRAIRLMKSGNRSQAVALATEALSELRRLGMQGGEASGVLEWLGWMAWFAGDVRGTDQRLSELEDLERSTGTPESSMAFGLKGWLALLKGELREARQALVERHRRAQGEGSEVALSLASRILREEDRPAEARALLERDHRLAISKGDTPDDYSQVACRAECDSKKYKEGLACLDEVSRYIKEDIVRVQVAVARGECHLAMGDATGALSALEQMSEVSKFPPVAAWRDVLRARAAA
ncbi:MAG: serine/threonine protein kinase, partial [Myxococcaceae bacterium]